MFIESLELTKCFTMKYIDLCLQTFVIVAGLTLFTLSLHNFWRAVLYTQSLTMSCQYISAASAACLGSRYKNAKKRYLLCSSLYVLITGMLTAATPWFNMPSIVMSWKHFTLFIAIPGSLTLYYYIITWKCALWSPSKLSRFLPHTSF